MKFSIGVALDCETVHCSRFIREVIFSISMALDCEAVDCSRLIHSWSSFSVSMALDCEAVQCSRFIHEVLVLLAWHWIAKLVS